MMPAVTTSISLSLTSSAISFPGPKEPVDANSEGQNDKNFWGEHIPDPSRNT